MEKAKNLHSKLRKSEFLPGIDLTQGQAQFVRALVRNGCTPTKAAQIAGFASPRTAGYELMRMPHVSAAIAFERQRYISGELANVATGTLKAIMEDKAAPAAARVSAARTVLEMAGNLAKGVPFATPVFDGASEEEIREMLRLAYPDEIAAAKGLTATRTQAVLRDGRTGDAFERAVTVA